MWIESMCCGKRKTNVQHRTWSTKTTKKHNLQQRNDTNETLKEDDKAQVDEKKDDGNEVCGNNNEEKRSCLHKAISGVAVGQEFFNNDSHSSSMKSNLAMN